MNNNIETEIKINDKKIDSLIEKEMVAGDNVQRGILAVLGTGTIALASLFTPIPIVVGVGAYALANVFMFGNLHYGTKVHNKIDILSEKNKELKKQRELANINNQNLLKNEKEKLQTLRQKLNIFEESNTVFKQHNFERQENNKVKTLKLTNNHKKRI